MSKSLTLRTFIFFLCPSEKNMSLLSGSEVFMLIMAGLSFLGACLGVILNFALKSRCTTIRACIPSRTRDVLPPDVAGASVDVSALREAVAR